MHVIRLLNQIEQKILFLLR